MPLEFPQTCPLPPSLLAGGGFSIMVHSKRQTGDIKLNATADVP